MSLKIFINKFCVRCYISEYIAFPYYNSMFNWREARKFTRHHNQRISFVKLPNTCSSVMGIHQQHVCLQIWHTSITRALSNSTFFCLHNNDLIIISGQFVFVKKNRDAYSKDMVTIKAESRKAAADQVDTSTSL